MTQSVTLCSQTHLTYSCDLLIAQLGACPSPSPSPIWPVPLTPAAISLFSVFILLFLLLLFVLFLKFHV